MTSIALFTSNKLKNDTSKKENIKLIIENTAVVNKANESILALLKETAILRDNLMKEYTKCLSAFGKDFTSLSEEMQLSLGSLVNNTLAIACLIEKGIE